MVNCANILNTSKITLKKMKERNRIEEKNCGYRMKPDLAYNLRKWAKKKLAKKKNLKG